MSLVLETEKPVIRLLAWQVYCDVSLEGTSRMSTASTQVLTCYKGDTSSFSVEIVQNGEACDITGHTLSWIISKAPSAAKLLQIDVTDHSDPAVGESVFEITAAMIEAIGGHGDVLRHIH